ncbi:uncharacterized protein METZ01_LOCUS118511, partial [marine metagenome]
MLRLFKVSVTNVLSPVSEIHRGPHFIKTQARNRPLTFLAKLQWRTFNICSLD